MLLLSYLQRYKWTPKKDHVSEEKAKGVDSRLCCPNYVRIHRPRGFRSWTMTHLAAGDLKLHKNDVFRQSEADRKQKIFLSNADTTKLSSKNFLPTSERDQLRMILLTSFRWFYRSRKERRQGEINLDGLVNVSVFYSCAFDWIATWLTCF